MINRKKTLSLLLALILVFLSSVPVFAVSDTPNIAMSIDSRSVQLGDTVTVTVTIVGEPKLSAFTGGLAFNKDIFECTSITNGNGENGMTLKINDGISANWYQVMSGVQSSVSEANGNGRVGFTFILSASTNMMVRMVYPAFFVVTFRAKAAGEAVFNLYEDSATYPKDGDSAYTNRYISPVTVSVAGASVTLSFDANGHGTAPQSQSVSYGAAPSKPADLSAEGWDFTGWFTDAACTQAFDFSAGLTGNATAYAGWKQHHYHTITAVAAKDATCEGNGNTAYYVCSECGKTFSDEAGTAEISIESTVTAPLGHDYKIDYSWNRELTKVTATATCKRDTSHKVTETANVEKRDPLAGCGESATITYTAKFSNSLFATQTRTENIASVPHQLRVTEAVAPSCNKSGSIEYYTCTVCGKMFKDAEGKEPVKIDDTKLEPLGHEMSADPVWKWSDDSSKASAEFTCGRCNEKFTVEAKVSKSYNVLTAAITDAESGKTFTDSKHVDSVTNRMTYLEAVGSTGQKIKVEMEPVASADILTPETVFSLIDTRKVKNARLDQFTVLWQRELKVPEGSGKVKLTLTTEGIGENEELLVFHRDASKGWQMVGYESGAQQISVTLDSLSPVALVKRTGAPVKEDPAPPARNDAAAEPGLISKLLSNKIVWIITAAVLVILILVLVLFGKKGKHSRSRHKK